MNGKLHHYTADTSDRTRINIILFVLGTISAYGLAQLLDFFDWKAPWWVETPSLFGFYGIYFSLFNEYLWRNSFFRKLLLIKTPDLNGKYDGQLSSSHDDFNSVKRVSYTIIQKWNKMLVFSETDQSCSESMSSAFTIEDVNRKSFVFHYSNQPKATAPDGMHPHLGFAEFYFETTDSITGEFFNGRGRNTYGKIDLKRNSQ